MGAYPGHKASALIPWSVVHGCMKWSLEVWYTGAYNIIIIPWGVCRCIILKVCSCCCRFSETYPDNNSITSALPFAMNSEFSGTLAKEMVRLIHCSMFKFTCWPPLSLCLPLSLSLTHTHTHNMQKYYTDTALSLLPSPNQVRLERIGVRDLGKSSKSFISLAKTQWIMCLTSSGRWPHFQTPLYNQCTSTMGRGGPGNVITRFIVFYAELSDDEGDVEKLQLLESGSSDVSFRSHDVSQNNTQTISNFQCVCVSPTY